MAGEVARGGVDRIDDDDLATRRTRRVDDRGQGTDQRLGAQATAVERLGQCQLREQDGGDLTRGSASELLGRFATIEHVRNDREVPDDLARSIDHDVRSRSLPRRLARVLLQPAVELEVARSEPREIVGPAECNDSQVQRGAIRGRRLALLAARASPGASSARSSAATRRSK